jgi:hypothetical protein
MLTQSEKESILSDFPNIKLSYENIVYNKVYNFDYVVAIPKGTKCFAWFTLFNNKEVCLIMELTNNKQITDIKLFNACFSNDLAHGTILYGTLFYTSNNRFFSIEDIFRYKGNNIERVCWGEKLTKIHYMIKNDIKQISYNNSFVVFGLPLLCKTINELDEKITLLKYNIDTIQFKLFNNMNKFLFMDYYTYNNGNNGNNCNNCNNGNNGNNVKHNNYIHKNNGNNNNNNNNNVNIKNNLFNNLNEKKIHLKSEYVFLLRPDIQDDIYYLYTLNNNLEEEKQGTTHIPDYNTSVMMNKIFRIIKENNNLDALEESDDEDEFENENIDKFVKLDSVQKMVCKYNHKFKKWIPIRIAEEHSKIISTDELKNIYKIYEQNKKKIY